MSAKPYEAHGDSDATAVPAAASLAFLAVGGWLLSTTRPWQKPGHPITLALEWTVSGALLLSGLVLLARCVRTVHGPDGAEEPAGAEN
ncbi:hypothetical protein OOK31_32145 [Streptomyces sp. NBC_00249]|uniref:hypothetical protein n=1 Tax=Streptomyces sp. NBC_00249 TaxID=2975690 RepID=UPI00225498D1|nr:hypothetical protein [Streptomyces sp. NBC_00249]MCX5198483.1 hypothetical protein [Streptomyces sp. NBC_00249]